MSMENEIRASSHNKDVRPTSRVRERWRPNVRASLILTAILCLGQLIFQYTQNRSMRSLVLRDRAIRDESDNIMLEKDEDKLIEKIKLIKKLAEVPKEVENKGKENDKEKIAPEEKRAELSKEDGKGRTNISTKEKETSEKMGREGKEGTSDGDDNTSKRKKRMNVLLLYADDWTSKTLGAAGNKIVKTPVLDDLAGKGIRFPENCVTTSICWVSRATLFTGLYMARHNTTMPSEFFVPWSQTIYDMFKQNGYFVGHVGKWGVWFDHGSKIDFQASEDGWHVRKVGQKIWQITEKNEADALRFLKTRDKSKPFFLNLAFFATHAVDGDKRQYLPQNKSLPLYENVTIPLPITATQKAWEAMPHFFNNQNEGRTRWRWRFDTPKKHQHMMKNYYRMASEVDSACGAVLEELKRQNELDNTFIVFTTDNGNFHAEHGLADKWYPHQESIQVPLIIVDPRMNDQQKGTLNHEFTLNIDLAPTLLSAANIPPLPQMQGRDIADLYLPSSSTQKMTPWRTEFFYEHPIINSKAFIPSSEALVRKDFKYFLWPDFQVEQLFNIKEDPYEQHDLIDSKAHQQQLESMRKRFLELKQIVHSDKIVTL